MSYFGRGALVKYLPKFARDFVHSLQFRPKHPHRMEPGQAANWVPEGAQKVERIKGYRYPAPGSREAHLAAAAAGAASPEDEELLPPGASFGFKKFVEA